ncbi:hypothetical protein JVU11DRAFT_4985 [Chiua virens]|nr:hypothetical protein JVU11DRAFT_4985 [Chiua virens]
MASSLQSLIVKHPTPFFSVGELALSAFALGPLPSFVPLIVLLSLLMIHGQRIARRHTRGRELLCSWISVTIGSAVAHWKAASTAVSNPTESLVAISLLSGATYSIVALSIYLYIRLRAPMNTGWAQLTLFPALWATVWSITSRVSPVGRLLNWWPAPVPSSYSWMLPFVGPVGIDWVVAGWAVVCSELGAQWLMGSSEDDLLETPNNKPLFSSRSKGLLSLATILLALTFPSTVSQNALPRSDVSAHTPLTVGCVLPTPLDGSHPKLEDFISETAKMTAAHVVLWPESAVVFNSEKEREDAFERIRQRDFSPLIGVAFDEYVVGDPEHTRNGFALVHKDQKPGDEVVQYYKRNLVPFTESFSKIPSVDPPVITQWQLKNPKGVTKPEWAPPPYTRPLPVTSSICLDFTSPTVFTNLDSRPALIMGPARTWDTTVGLAMWEQARARAEELGSMVLWCDGGSAGVSGIGGASIQEPMQIGGSSWMRTIGMPYPLEEKRTVYALGGDFSVVALLLALMGGGVASELLVAWTARGGTKMVTKGRKIAGRVPFMGRLISSGSTAGEDCWQTRTSHALLPSKLAGRAYRPSSQVRISRAWLHTTSAHNFLQSKLPRGLRGSLRSSTVSFDPSRLLARAFPLFGKKQPPQKDTSPDEPAADFELITSDDIPADIPPLLSHTPDPPDSSVTTPPQPSLSRTKSTLFRLKNISKVSIHLSSFTDSRASSSRTRTATDESDICLAFPKPPTHIPTPDTSVPGASIQSDTPPPPTESSAPDASTSSSINHDPFSAGCTVPADQDVTEPEPDTKLGPSVPRASLARRSSRLVKRNHRFTGSLKRFKSLSQILRDSFAPHPVDASSVDAIRNKKRWNHQPDSETVSSAPANPFVPLISPIPEVLRSPTHSSPSFAAGDTESDSSPPASISSLPEESPTPIPVPPPLRRKHSAPAGLGRGVSLVSHYQFVSPSELAASPLSLVRSSLVNSSARSSFLPPSPSWLSRNVNQFDPSELSATCPPSRISALSDSEHLRIPEIITYYRSALFAPDSPHPLPIPPPRIPVLPPQPCQSTASSSRPILQPLLTNVCPESPETDSGSFVTSPTPLDSTLYSPTSSTTPTTAFASALPSPSPQLPRRLSNISPVSVERHRQSIARLKKSRTSSPRAHRQLTLKASRTSLNPIYKDLSTRRQLSNGLKSTLVKAPLTPVSSGNSDHRTIFRPSIKQLESKQSPLPQDLALLLEAFFVQSGLLDSFSPPKMDYTGKNQDVVDFGGEVDYSGHQWFQEPPPRPEPQPVVQPYIPDDDVIKQNEAYDFALKAAPNVLYGRFKQYGQLGVLAWCSEFGEMIDSLKELGFSGNMFVATRAQALRTCEEILKLKLDIKMQIILMYLSSQVARLRRFLDGGERQWDDYPVPEFPLDYRAYSS